MKSVIPFFEWMEIIQVQKALKKREATKWIICDESMGRYWTGEYFGPFLKDAKRFDTKAEAHRFYVRFTKNQFPYIKILAI